MLDLQLIDICRPILFLNQGEKIDCGLETEFHQIIPQLYIVVLGHWIYACSVYTLVVLKTGCY